MTARRETVIAEVLNRLETVPNVALVLRQPNAQPSTSHALTLDDRGQRVIEAGAIHNVYALQLVISGYVQGAGAAGAAALNEFYAATVRVLMADGAQLGGIAREVTEGDLQIDSAAIDQKFTHIFELAIDITFTARTHDPALN
ncbi:MAG: hypothetical protein B7Y35_06085 [Sphingomonadales bacterium 28-64-96]|nr:MAG: hypothetical protein B7Y35_06085 [Sphingomonadales bacterium 28-64-96]